MNQMLVVFMTCDGREQAERIAQKLVEERLVACVNVVPGIRSCYVWEGKLSWSEELLLIAKTTPDAFESLKKRVCELHSYEVPEIVAVPVEAVAEKYGEWVRQAVPPRNP